MKRILRYLLILSASVLLVPGLAAQEKEHGKFVRFFSRIGDRMTQSLVKGMDTTYVALPEHPFIAALTYRGASLHHYISTPSCPVRDALIDEIVPTRSVFEISTGFRSSIGISAGYRNTMVRYFQNIGNRAGKILNVSSYGNRYGGEIFYQRTKSVHASMTIDPLDDPAKFPGDVRKNMENYGAIAFSRLCINAYYVISPKRFSYSAAMRGSVIQLRSAGSFIASMTYYRTNTDLGKNIYYNSEYFEKDMKIMTNQLAVGFGYAHNFVLPWRHMLVHLSLQPMMTLNVKNSSTGSMDMEFIDEFFQHDYDHIMHFLNTSMNDILDLQKSFSDHHGVGFACQAKLAVVIPISQRLSFSLDGEAFYFNSGRNGGNRTHTLDTTLHASFGVRF